VTTVLEAADEGSGRDLASRVLDPGRDRPLVGISTLHGGRGAPIDPHALAGELGEAAEVWLVETGPATWALADDLPERLEVFGGAVRIWWPGASWDAVPEDHPLLFIREPAGADRVRAQVASLVARQAARREGATGTEAAVPPVGSPAAARGAGEVAALTTELHAASAEREQLAGQLRQERARSQALARRLRIAEERLAALEQADTAEDPFADGEAFLRGVAAAYGRIYSDADREDFPLGQMAVGPGFLESARTLEGIDRSRILDVCAHVAAGRAWHISGLRVHPLRSGRGGAPQRRRPGGAQAWRCALQVGSPAARRLHWWAIPGPGGGTVEFDSVGTHDDGLE
jgi:hypothetical protein